MAKNKRRLTAPRPAQPNLMMFCVDPLFEPDGHDELREVVRRQHYALRELIAAHNAFVKGVVGLEARRYEAARRLHSPAPAARGSHR